MKLTAIALGAILTAAVHGATLYDTLGPDNRYRQSGATIGGIDGLAVGNWISPLIDGKAASITLAMGHTSGENRYRLDFMTSGFDGAPSVSLYGKEFSIGGDLTTVALQNGPDLTEGGDLWLVVRGVGQNTQGAWWGSENSSLGTAAWRDKSEVKWNVMGDSHLGAVRIEDGVVDPVATPEPTTALLAGPALLLLGWMRRKRS